MIRLLRMKKTSDAFQILSFEASAFGRLHWGVHDFCTGSRREFLYILYLLVRYDNSEPRKEKYKSIQIPKKMTSNQANHHIPRQAILEKLETFYKLYRGGTQNSTVHKRPSLIISDRWFRNNIDIANFVSICHICSVLSKCES